MNTSSFLLLVLFGFGLFACSKASDDLQHYKTLIPDEERLNASILHREWLEENIKSAYDQGNDAEVLEHIKTYYEVFRSTSASAFVDYYLGMSVGRLIDEVSFVEQVRRMSPDMRLVYGVKKVSSEGEPLKLAYDHRHLSNLVEQRKGYRYERRAMEALFLLGLSKATSRSVLQNNLKHLNWALKRYPDAAGYGEAISSDDFFSGKLLKETGLQATYDDLLRFFERYEHGRVLQRQKNLPRVPVAFANTYFCVVRNRTHKITSRNLVRLERWEPIEVFESDLDGEDGHLWCLVRVRGDLFGYVPQAQLEFVLTKRSQEAARQYLAISKQYYGKQFLELSPALVRRMENSTGEWRERYLVLLNATLREVAKRATSANNPFTEFVYKHPNYFKLSASRQELVPSFLVLNALLALNEHSLFLPYFGGYK